MLLNIFRQSVCSWRNSEARRGASCLTQSVWALVQHFGCNEAIVLRSTCQPLRKLDICKFDSICVANWAWDDMRINWLLDTNVLCHQCRSNTAGGAAFETKKHTARNRVPRSYHAETHYFHVRSFNLCCRTHPSQFARQANVEIVDAARDTNYNIYCSSLMFSVANKRCSNKAGGFTMIAQDAPFGLCVLSNRKTSNAPVPPVRRWWEQLRCKLIACGENCSTIHRSDIELAKRRLFTDIRIPRIKTMSCHLA